MLKRDVKLQPTVYQLAVIYKLEPVLQYVYLSIVWLTEDADGG